MKWETITRAQRIMTQQNSAIRRGKIEVMMTNWKALLKLFDRVH